jgi:four helix bundle protein
MCNDERKYRDILGDRLIECSIFVIKMEKLLPQSYISKHIYSQLFRSMTSAGANFEESVAAQTKADFIYKTQIVLKELREAHFWIKLISKSEILKESSILKFLNEECKQLVKIFSSSLITAKGLKNK